MDIQQSLRKPSLIHSGKILASALNLAKNLSLPENTPLEIDLEIYRFILKEGATPSFLGLGGYPYTTCIAVNDQIVHAVPTSIPFKQGDLVTVDIGVSYEEHCTDAARTFVVGETKNKTIHNLINTATAALDEGIQAATSNNRVGDISYSIQRCVELNGFRSPLLFGGHGIGRLPHLEPFISNTGMYGQGEKLISGICLALEPIVMAGSIEVFIDENDGYTVYSEDGKLSSHAEDTIIVTDQEPIILTRETLRGNTI